MATLEIYKVIPGRLPLTRKRSTPLWTVEHFLLKHLCDGQSTAVDSWISQKEQKCSPTNEVNNVGDETFEESEFQNRSGTFTFEMEACKIFLKWILAEAPKDLLNPCWLTWGIVGQLLLRRKKKINTFLFHDSNQDRTKESGDSYQRCSLSCWE